MTWLIKTSFFFFVLLFPFVKVLRFLLNNNIFCLGIDGLGDTRLICGITAAEKKGKQEKEDKVSDFSFNFEPFYLLEDKICVCSRSN